MLKQEVSVVTTGLQRANSTYHLPFPTPNEARDVYDLIKSEAVP
jgi:hypothetical protein